MSAYTRFQHTVAELNIKNLRVDFIPHILEPFDGSVQIASVVTFSSSSADFLCCYIEQQCKCNLCYLMLSRKNLPTYVAKKRAKLAFLNSQFFLLF